MKTKRLASMLLASAMILSACTLTTSPKSNATKSPVASGTPAAQVGATGSQTSTEQTGAYIEPTPTEEITSTTELTPTAEVTPTVEVTPTAVVTTTTEVTATTTETPAPGAVNEVVTTTVKTVVVRVRSLNVRSGPGTDFSIVARLAFGRVAKVNGASADGQWYRILCANGKEGDCWVASSSRYVIARK